MREDLKYSSIDAVESVLAKIGIDPETRVIDGDQDYEYTTCKIEELPQYIELYEKDDTSIYEKRVLGCYFLECLNDYVQDEDAAHKLQDGAFRLLHRDTHIHESELEYWTETSDPDEENWWPITRQILNWRKRSPGHEERRQKAARLMATLYWKS